MKKVIDIPDGYEINWEESKKANKIIMKPINLTYEDICNELFSDKWYFTNSVGTILTGGEKIGKTCPNNSTTEHQLQVLLAKNRLANVAKYLNSGWKPTTGTDKVFYIYINNGKINITDSYVYRLSYCILFKDYISAKKAINILGEEQIKLALSNLY